MKFQVLGLGPSLHFDLDVDEMWTRIHGGVPLLNHHTTN